MNSRDCSYLYIGGVNPCRSRPAVPPSSDAVRRRRARPAAAMTRATDRTERFRALCAAHREARAQGAAPRGGDGDPSVGAPLTRAACGAVREYARAAQSALAATSAYVDANRAEYKRADARARDAFEAECAGAMKECQRCVGAARDGVERARARGGALARAPQCAAHLHGIGLILSERLNDVARKFDKVRETRFAATLERAERERRRKAAAKKATYDASAGRSGTGDPSTSSSAVRVERVERVEQAQAHVERQDALEEELTQLLDQVRLAEKNVLEMSALSSLFSTHVQAQAEQIEALYQDAIESSRHLDWGNVEMKKTIERKGGAQRIIAFIFLVATLGLLFLDWYSG